jgi:hypothetical protein
MVLMSILQWAMHLLMQFCIVVSDDPFHLNVLKEMSRNMNLQEIPQLL